MISLMLLAAPACSESLLQTVRHFLSFGVPEHVLDSINTKIVGNIRAKNIRFFLPNKIKIDHAEIFDEFGEKVLSSPHIEASVSLFSLLTNNIIISKAVIEEPYFNYKIKKSVHNVVRLFDSPTHEPDSSKKSKLRVTITHARVINGRFYMMHDAGVEIFAYNINAQGRFFVEDGPFGIDIAQLNIKQGNIKIGNMNLPLTNLVSRNLWVSDEKVATHDLSAFYEKAHVTGSGTVYIDHDYYDVIAHIKAPPNTYPKGLKPLPFIAPAFTARAELAGPLDAPEIKVDMHAGATNFNGLDINKINISGQINPQEIRVLSSKFFIGKSGLLQAHGGVDIKRSTFSFESVEDNIPSTELLQFFSLKVFSEGLISARTKISGDFGIKHPVFYINTAGNIKDGLFDKIKLGEKTTFDVNADYFMDTKVIIKPSRFTDERGLKLRGSGLINLREPTHNFTYDLAAPSLRRYVPNLGNDFEANNFSSHGNVSVQNNIIQAQGTAQAAFVKFRDYNARLVEFKFNLNNKDLFIRDLHAQAYKGTIMGDISIKDFAQSQKIEGHARFAHVDLSEPTKKITSVDVEGLLDGQLWVAGSLQKPDVSFDAQFSHLVIDQLMVPHTLVYGNFSNNILKLNRLNAEGFLGSAMGQDLSYDIKTDKLAGSFDLNDFNVGNWLNKYLKDLGGVISGPVHVAGTLTSPQITAPLMAKNIKFMAHKLGSGSLALSLKREALVGKKGQEDLVLSVSALLEDENSHSSWQGAMALDQKSINIRAQLTDFKFDSSQLSLENLRFGVKGFLNGSFSAEGPLDDLSLSAEMASDDYVFFDPVKRLTNGQILNDYGPASLNAVLKNGRLELSAMASLGGPRGGVLFSVDGPCNFSSCNLDVSGMLDYDHWEDLIPSLKNELAMISAHMVVDGKLSKQKNTPWVMRADMQLQRFLASVPAIPHVELAEPVSLSYTDQKLVIHKKAQFLFSPGDLVVAGSVGPEIMDLKLKGAIPLIFVRLVAPLVQRAEGLARGELSLSGSFAEPVFDGLVAVEPGSEVTFNRWLESLEFKEGSIVFKKTSPTSFSSELRAIKLALGDGRIYINGSFDRRKEIFDVQIEGSNIVIKDKGQFVESDVNLTTIKNSKGQTTLKGTIAVTDGLAYRQFDLRNFVARASQSAKLSAPKFLETLSLNLDLDVAVRQFKASARMLNIDIDSNLTGQIKTHGNINSPEFGGFLSVSEGKIIFPAATFDLYESRIDLDEYSHRGFNPKINITSTLDFDREQFPIQRDTTVQLALTGDLDQLKLELKPVAGDLKLSQTKIFLMLLMPRSVGASTDEEVLRRSAQNAALAFSGEVFLRPLTNELQELLEEKTKTRIQFGSALEPGGVTFRMNWKIGPRIEAQGFYMYISDDYHRLDAERKSFLTDSYSLGDLKLKLILFDHKPFGPLFLEGSFGVNRLGESNLEPRGLFRLSYRILSK